MDSLVSVCLYLFGNLENNVAFVREKKTFTVVGLV